MNDISRKLAVALVHHPVLNRRGEVVTTSVTTLDTHDLARLLRTYDVPDLFIVTPLAAQRRLVERLARHWTDGFGAEHNPSRREALKTLKVVDSIGAMVDNLKLDAAEVRLIFTGARKAENAASFAEARRLIRSSEKTVLLLGTGHGLAGSVLEMADMRLEPIEGVGDYNHLPVRMAAAIMLDRLVNGEREGE
ncbi:MAG: RNA methyltransferase [Candidatus Nitrospinota bacterium M3_3B_026]